MPRNNRKRETASDPRNYSGPGGRRPAPAGTASEHAPAENPISLESILAEYKGKAYIAGDKKTPPSVLQEKTDQIVLEATGRLPRQPGREDDAAAPPDMGQPPPDIEAVLREKEREYGDLAAAAHTADGDVIPFEQLRGAPDGEADSVRQGVEQAIGEQTRLEEQTRSGAEKFFGLFTRGREAMAEPEDTPVDDDLQPLPEEEDDTEPDYQDAARRFAERCNSYALRSLASLVLSIIMALVTLLVQSGARLPFDLGANRLLSTGILLILLFFVMMLSVDRLIDGAADFIRGRQGADSLNLFSCLASAAAAAYCLITGNTAVGLPFCAVSAFSLTFTLMGEKTYYRALTETMKTALSVSEPYGVIAETNDDIARTIIRKVSGRTAGFYNNLVQADVGETVYKYAAPVLIVSAVVLSFYASVGQGRGAYFLQSFAAVMAAAAPFSAVQAFAVPFNAVSRRARQAGAAVAGWGGADELFHTDGASITDEDIFPSGTVSLAGIKIFEEVEPQKALRYTASLIIASDSVLAKVFKDQLSRHTLNMIRVEEFACYEGGIAGLIRGERVLTGSAAFMNLMGIRVPASLNMKNAVFTAVNKRLIAVFSINYVPVKSVQSALVSVLRYRVRLFFAVRDFNISPVMLEQKFKVPVDNVEYMPIRSSYDMSDDSSREARRVAAILTREGMGPYVEAITAGRRLRSTSLAATAFTLLSAVGGMLIMYAICWAGAFESANPGNLLIYMLSMLAIALIICGFARYRQ